MRLKIGQKVMLGDDAKRTDRDSVRVKTGGTGYARAPQFVAPLIVQYKPIIKPGRLVGGNNPVEFVRHHSANLVARSAHFVRIDDERRRVQVQRLLIATA